jgi:S1-C subfamily serine protease
VIDSLPKFAASLFLHRHDELVQMDVLRGNQVSKLQIPAMESQAGMESLAEVADPQQALIAPLGIFTIEMNRTISEALPNVRSNSGVLVAGTVDYAPAVAIDLVTGDVIRSINGLRLSGTNDLRAQLERLKVGDPVVLEIERQGTYQFIAFEME